MSKEEATAQYLKQNLKLNLLFVQQGNPYISLSKAKAELIQRFGRHGVKELVGNSEVREFRG